MKYVGGCHGWIPGIVRLLQRHHPSLAMTNDRKKETTRPIYSYARYANIYGTESCP